MALLFGGRYPQPVLAHNPLLLHSLLNSVQSSARRSVCCDPHPKSPEDYCAIPTTAKY